MSELSCEQVMERIPALIVGDLSPDEEAEIDRHAQSCASCAAELREVWMLARALDQLAEQSGLTERIAEALPTLRERIRAALPAEIAYDQIDSPIGPLLVAATEDGLCRVSFGESDDELGSWAESLGRRSIHDSDELRPYARQLREYFAGERVRFDLPLDLSSATPFARRVLGATAAIPFGRLASYRDIAVGIGQPGATRAVGNALGSNPVPIVVPCHRVIRSNGAIGGYTGGLDIKWRLLAIEGVSLGLH